MATRDGDLPNRPVRNVVFTALTPDDDRPVSREPVEGHAKPLSDEAFRPMDPETKEPEPSPPADQEEGSKLHPLVRRRIAEDGQRREELVLTLRGDLAIPRFPEPVPPDSERFADFEEETDRLIDELRQLREEDEVRQRVVARLAELDERDDLDGVRIIDDDYWLVNVLIVELRLADVGSLIVELGDDLAYVEPVHTEDRPPMPGGGPSGNFPTPLEARKLVRTDPYFALDLGRIALLDTGTFITHELVPDTRTSSFDCVADPTCTSGCAAPCDEWDHGTAAAAIITGNDARGDPYRGVSEIEVYSYRVYDPPVGTNGLNTWAALDAFQAAIKAGARVIAAEIQGLASMAGSLNRAADQAYNAGAAVVAANGNSGSVKTPASAHLALGVGAYSIANLDAIKLAEGPTGDGRVKPDILAPTGTETASADGVDHYEPFGQTSGATPYAAAAAALIRNWVLKLKQQWYGGATVDPGEVYVLMILAGENRVAVDNQNGAGLLRLPNKGFAAWTTVDVSAGNGVEFELPIPPKSRGLSAALWWPEASDYGNAYNDVHNDIDLYLLDPLGVVQASSIRGGSVFERATVRGALQDGPWTLRIVPYDVTGVQTVYVAAALHEMPVSPNVP